MREHRDQWRTAGEGPTPAGRVDEFAVPPPAPGELARREFFGVLSALTAFTAAGCSRQPPEAIVPRANPGHAAPPGEPLVFATAVLRRGAAIGVYGVTVDGRPVKLEGNPAHPASLGASDAQVQAELLSFYHPDRASTVRRAGRITSMTELERALRPRLDAHLERSGKGLAVIFGPFTSPSRAAQVRSFIERAPGARIYRHATCDDINGGAGVSLAFGRRADILHDFARASVVISFGDGFLDLSPARIAHAKAFARRRAARDASMPRLYVAEPAPTITGAVADHRLPAGPRRIETLLTAFAAELGILGGSDAALADHERRWVRAAADDAARDRGHALVLCGPMLPPEFHALALVINDHLGGFGSTIHAIDPIEPDLPFGDLASLVRDAGEIETLIVLDANPVYSAPADLPFASAFESIACTVHACVFPDETTEAADWQLPLAHPLESWDDARAFDGTITPLQPLIEPLYGGYTPGQVVSWLTRPLVPEALELVRGFYRERFADGDTPGFDSVWRSALRAGVFSGTAFPFIPVSPDRAAVLDAFGRRVPPDEGAMTLTIRPDPCIADGRLAHNQWLQELPKPITKLVWTNALELAPADAARLSLADGDVVEVRAGDQRAEAPVWITPGHAAGCASLTLGYGRPDRISAHTGGASAYLLRTAASPWRRDGITIRPAGRRQPLVTTQTHGQLSGRNPIHRHALGGEPPREERRIPLTLYPEFPTPGAQWGMTIDLTACIGCGACTIACQAENNIPWVGPEQVDLGREMHWIRVDRYFDGPIEDPGIMHQPVPCMHCEKAPCEPVCPVGATQHSHDGLNEMIYNRCVGTRYCSNNCPYKVRRFNFLKYVNTESESLRLMRNPEVTVRARGIMEKCTYCVQRIRNGEIVAKREGRTIRDGEVRTACQQACPTEAISFGDIADPESEISRLRRRVGDYDLLGELGTRPRTTYMPLVRNPNRPSGAPGASGEAGDA